MGCYELAPGHHSQMTSLLNGTQMASLPAPPPALFASLPLLLFPGWLQGRKDDSRSMQSDGLQTTWLLICSLRIKHNGQGIKYSHHSALELKRMRSATFESHVLSRIHLQWAKVSPKKLQMTTMKTIYVSRGLRLNLQQHLFHFRICKTILHQVSTLDRNLRQQFEIQEVETCLEEKYALAT